METASLSHKSLLGLLFYPPFLSLTLSLYSPLTLLFAGLLSVCSFEGFGRLPGRPLELDWKPARTSRRWAVYRGAAIAVKRPRGRLKP